MLVNLGNSDSLLTGGKVGKGFIRHCSGMRLTDLATANDRGTGIEEWAALTERHGARNDHITPPA